MTLDRECKRTELLLFAIVICGLVLMAIYVHEVYLLGRQVLPAVFFWVFVSVYSISILLLWATAHERRLVIIAIFLSASVIASLFFLRFYFYGTDLTGEYFTAQITRESGRWMPERVTGNAIWLDSLYTKGPTEILSRYFATTSVTILPAMLSEVTGVSTLGVFLILVSVVSTAFVVVAFLIARLCFGERIASLSSIIVIFLSFYLGKFPNLLREDVGLLFLVLAFFCILKGRKALVTGLISLLVLPMSHYSMVYFAILFFLLLFMGSKIYESNRLKRIVQRINPHLRLGESSSIVSGYLVLFVIAVGTMWLMFIASPIFKPNIGGLAGAIASTLGLSPVHSSYFQGHLIVSSLGPFTTGVDWLERVLALLGFGFTIVAIRSARALTKKAFLFVFAGAGLLAAAILLAIVPNVSQLFDLDRTMQVALLPFSVFIAVAVFKIYNLRRFTKPLAILLVAVFLLSTLQIPILYTPSANLSRESFIFSFTTVVAYYNTSDFQFAKWADEYTSNSSVFASDAIGVNLCLIAERIGVEPRAANSSDVISLIESGKTDYFLVLTYLSDYMMYALTNSTSLVLNSTEISELLNSMSLDRIYDNGRAINFAYAR